MGEEKSKKQLVELGLKDYELGLLAQLLIEADSCFIVVVGLPVNLATASIFTNLNQLLDDSFSDSSASNSGRNKKIF